MPEESSEASPSKPTMAEGQASEELLYYVQHGPPVIPGYEPGLRTDPYYTESGGAKFKRKALENPFIPAGCILTAIILTVGLWTMKTRNRELSQTMMRARVGAQGVTVFAMVAGVIYQKFGTKE